MFYSQFILAKKGPLGTIWIAAHLERKLRKNQVADTDIGVSVDSILFPDVPIALRLSSHLLLGVVRIYSRKVNYLFDDCSEALLKIKQAFRSTAVDLPPEESTAPYHSITLPETFDLDDFELPDSDIFQGNYVDHHVSSREQITLQDTMDGVVYSTSQFGPDERFGDGDAAGLDLDEELLLDKIAAAGEANLTLGSDVGHQPSVQPTTPGVAYQMEVGEEDTDFAEYAQAPCTPGLMEEPNLSKIQDTSACDDHMEIDNHTTSELSVKENLENSYSKSEIIQHEIQNTVKLPLSNPDTVPPEKNGYRSDGLESPQMSQPPNDVNIEDKTPTVDSHDTIVMQQHDNVNCDGKTPEGDNDMSASHMDHQVLLENNLNGVKILVNGTNVSNNPSGGEITNEDLPPVLEVSFSEYNQGTLQVCNGEEKEGKQAEKPIEESNGESSDIKLGNGNLESEPCQQSNGSEKVIKYSGPHLLLPCTTTPLNPPCEELSGIRAKDSSIQSPEGVGDVENLVKALEDNYSSISGVEKSVGNDDPPPEQMLSAAEEVHKNIENNMLQEKATPDKEDIIEFDRAGAVSMSVSGKKRSFTESTLTVQSLYSAESSGNLHTEGRIIESVPDDNDLLSSILVGRKSSALKVKATPIEKKSMKRQRSTTRPSSYKRKVLMDDSMVLHGDTIRQQLTNTEDIRRVRKKAPCTGPEISLIQRHFLEDEIFSEPVLAGESVELASFHNQTYDLSEINVSPCDVNESSLEGETNLKSIPSCIEVTEMSVQLDVIKENEIDTTEPTIVTDEPQKVQPEDQDLNSEIHSVQADIGICSSPREICFGEIADVENYEKCIPDVNRIDADEAAGKIDNDAGVAGDVEEIRENEDPKTIDANEEIVVGSGEGVDLVVVDTEFRETDDANGSEGGSLVDLRSEIQPLSSPQPPEILSTTQTIDEDEIKKSTEDHAANETILDSANGLWNEHDSSNIPEGNMMDLRNAYMGDDGDNPSQLPDDDVPLVTEVEASTNLNDNDDFDYSTAGHDTEFLNFDDDDDEEAEADDDIVPNAEETKFIENSGWSSRTRAVANYLQSLFEKEEERGRKVIVMDNLLAGKTRKEASRMFFEALVLKTKDYVHVEQKSAYESIKIQPRHKLLKSGELSYKNGD